MTRSTAGGESRAQRAARRNNNAAAAASAAASSADGSSIKKEDEREVKQEDTRSSRRRDKRSAAGGGSSKNKRKGGPPSNNNRDNLNSNGEGGGGGGGGDEAQQPPPPPQNDVLAAFYNMLQQGAPQQAGLGAGGEEYEDIHIDLEIASNVLEAAAGNLSLAMNLYWDHYFASQANNNNNNNQDVAAAMADNNNRADDARRNDEGLDRKPAARGQRSSQRHGHHHDDDDNDNDENGSGDDDDVKEILPSQRRRSSRNSSSSKKNLKRSSLEAHLEEDSSPQPKRRLRRSLDSDFRAAEEKDEKKKKKKKSRKNIKNNKMENNNDSNNESNNDEDDKKMPAINRNNEGNDQDDGDNPYAPNENNDNENNNDDIEELIGNEVEAALRRAVRRNRPRRGREQPQRGVIVLDGEAEASISVSDDELGEVKRKQTRRRRNPPRRPKPPLKMDTARRAAVLKAAESISRKVAPNQFNKKMFPSPEQEQRKERHRHSGDGNDSEDPEDYISDSDWLEVDLKPSLSSESLWGTFTPLPPPLPLGEENNNNNDDNNNNDNNNNEGGNVVAEDDDEVQIVVGKEKDANNNASSSSGSVEAAAIDVSTAVVGIPHTWLNCGFELSDCGSGLVIKSPNVEDIEFFTWRQQQVGGNRNAVPPPYHCKTLTAIISSVTALLYTGVSIQGDEVNCTSGKKPWASLTAEERKREFESRLVDALSSLIFVAAKASLKRKQKAYSKAIIAYDSMDNINNNMKEEQQQATEELKQKKKGEISDGSDNGNNNKNGTDEPVSSNDKTTNTEKKATLKNKKEQMRRRLDLIPTCVWDDEKVAISSRTTEGPSYNSDVKVKTSWTNIRDIKLYVRSNMRAFAAKGGVALLLETITKIHGNKVIARQLKQLSVKPEPKEIWGGCTTSSSNKSISALICCTCEERQKKIYEEKPLPLNVRIDPRKLLDTTPPGNECASVQLLTLILTGRAHSNWSNCSTEGLGFGLLTEHTGEVGHSLARPKNPVWLLRGETCYSLLSFEGRWGCKFGGQLPDLKTVSKVDQPGMSIDFCHWNGWYGQRGKSGMRLITSKEKNQIPSKELLSRFTDHHHRQGTENTKSLLMERRRHDNLVKTVSAEEHKSNETRESENQIRPLELERMKIHPDDQKLYPKKYALWRFDVNEDENTPLEDRKKQAENWIPYYRLTSRQKKIVEIKLGPKINTILWTRWPDAKIDNFTPKVDCTFPVV
ncbi:MAG: hypothetical protein ACI8RD_011355 [Bacillariaceae sp.]|jgi:hypothetical protein